MQPNPNLASVLMHFFFFFGWQNTNLIFIVCGLTENWSKWSQGVLAKDNIHTVTALAAR